MNRSLPDPGARATRALWKVLGSAAFLETLPIGIYCCDREGVIWTYNRRAAELWGRSPEIGETDQRFCGAHKLLLPDGRPLPHHESPMAEVLRSGASEQDLTVIIERPDGTRITALVNIDPLYDDDGRFVGAVNCFQNITEVTQTHEELQRTKDDLEDFFENGAVGLHIVGRDGLVLRANKAELELLGYTASEYLGRHIAEFHVDPPAIADILARLGRGERVEKYPARLRAKDGSIRHVLITSNAQFCDGQFIHTRCFTFDVTERELAEERMREGEQRFRDLLEALPAAIYVTDADGEITYCNQTAMELTRGQLALGSDNWRTIWRLYSPEGAFLSPDQYPLEIALREQRPIRDAEIIAERPDGSIVRFISYPTPLFDGQGRLTGAVNILVETTERHEAELEAMHLAAIVASSDDAIVSKTLDGTVRSWNAGATRIFGYEESEMLGQPIYRIIPPELHEEEQEILSRLRQGERIDHYETVRVTKDGRHINISLTVSPVRDRAGRIVAASKVARDITERKRAEALQRLLIGELNHRVKNTLATVQAIASQTVRLAKSPAEFAASFSGRIQALAHAHDLLTQNAWQGTEVLPLIRDQLLLSGAEDNRVALSGPTVVLAPQPALHLALVLHELGTNARKYGSLSDPKGRLSVTWTVQTKEGRILLLRWEEKGGPAVKAPSARGFGMALVERSLAAHGGESCLSFHAEGVTCDISLPLPERTQAVDAFAGLPKAPTSPLLQDRTTAPSALQGRRVLIVEDEPIIAMDMIETLSEAGCVAVGPAPTVEKAAELIAAAKFDAVLLDANLGGRPIDELVATLIRLKIPFAFLTGYGREELPEAFRQARLVKKPFTRNETIELVRQLVEDGDPVVRLRRKNA